MDNSVVLTGICIRGMKTAPFVPFCEGAGAQNCFETRAVVLPDCVSKRARPGLPAGARDLPVLGQPSAVGWYGQRSCHWRQELLQDLPPRGPEAP